MRPQDPLPGAAALRRAVNEATDADLFSLAQEVQEALGGDSNDAEHDALHSAASLLGIRWTSYEDREDDEDE